jgi:2-polyprenyl-3-methyl-5-hydroxy-6-metoxy-1,4-benzoquinol methylase
MTTTPRDTGVLDPVVNASTRFNALSTIFDSGTRRRLLNRGLAPGWHCLEVGGGGGSIARWLSERVGAGGRVVVTDIDTRFVEKLKRPNLEVFCHDITRDQLAEQAFDLIHTRMVLIHLPERDDVLRRLVTALKPGGWLVCEEFDGLSLPPDPAVSPGEAVLKTHEAMRRLNGDRHVDPRCGRLLFGRFRALGLAEVGAEAHLCMVQAGSPFATLLRASYQLRRSAMIDAGYITAEEFDHDLARMEEPEFMTPSPMMWTVLGRHR